MFLLGAIHKGCPARGGREVSSIEETGGQGGGGVKPLADVRFKIFGAHTWTRDTSNIMKNHPLIDYICILQHILHLIDQK